MLHRNIPVWQRVDPATSQAPVINVGTAYSDASGRSTILLCGWGICA